MVNHETKRLAALATFLRVYGVLSLIIFVPLFVGFAIQTPLLAEGGARFTAPPGSEPPEIVEPGTIDDLFIRLRSAQVFTGDYVDLGMRGAIPVGLYRPFILAHCAHHLSFLIPAPRR